MKRSTWFLTSVTGGAFELNCAAAALLTIVDNETNLPGKIGFAAAEYEVDEDDGSALITVSRTNGNTGIVTMHYSTSDGTATNMVDYGAMAGTLTWGDGDTNDKTFIVPIIADSLIENNESVNLHLSDPSVEGTLDTLHQHATLFIRDAPPDSGYIEFNPEIYETDENEDFVSVIVSRVGGSVGAAAVDYATQK